MNILQSIFSVTHCELWATWVHWWFDLNTWNLLISCHNECWLLMSQNLNIDLMLVQGPYGMGGGSWGDPSKASSAFSPINSGVGLPTSTGLILSLSSASPLKISSCQGSTWEVQAGVTPSTTPSHSKDKARWGNSNQNFDSSSKDWISFNRRHRHLSVLLPIPTHKDFSKRPTHLGLF